ncbi:MAG: hypothetical protein M0P69_03735 [Bacteroidales bacterium]|nr:hypothetical protein [Bacteroidales bacterium]
MADSIRELIIQDLVTELKKIVRYDDANIVRGKTFFRTAELPGLAIFPGKEESVKAYGQQRNTMPVEVSAAAISGTTNCSVLAETIQAEIEKCVIGGMSGNSRIESCAYTGGGVDDWPDAGDQAITVTCVFSIVYTTIFGDPYSITYTAPVVVDDDET